jgi:hypothetical protein
MANSRSRLAVLIAILALATLLMAFAITSLVLALAGDWEKHTDGLTLALKIMWGLWLLTFAAVILTGVTIFGWRFRKAQPGRGPAALARAIAEGFQPASWLKTTATSFTITVVLVSLLGGAVLASVLIWILGDWDKAEGPLTLALKLIWGAWWVLCIATVLVRVAIFGWQRNKARMRAGAEQRDHKESSETASESTT